MTTSLRLNVCGIDDFLDIQRMGSPAGRVNPRPLALRPLLERAVFTVRDSAAHRLVLEAPDDLPEVEADEDRILQVLANLLSNALKYSPEGGDVHLFARAAESAVEVSVSDEGLGIPPETLPHLFEKFYRIDDQDRRTIPGTGLGLAICKEIIDAHHGTIWAESAGPRRGARFAFTLPIVAAPG